MHMRAVARTAAIAVDGASCLASCMDRPACMCMCMHGPASEQSSVRPHACAHRDGRHHCGRVPHLPYPTPGSGRRRQPSVLSARQSHLVQRVRRRLAISVPRPHPARPAPRGVSHPVGQRRLLSSPAPRAVRARPALHTCTRPTSAGCARARVADS